MEYDLAIVMPVFNEAECVVDVVQTWVRMLNKLNLNFVVFVLNDGSNDNTKEQLNKFEKDHKIRVIHKKNSGHGPTILMGYRKAVDVATWVFQTDSDNEIHAEHFPTLWQERHHYNAIFGLRSERSQNIIRKCVSWCSRLTCNVIYGKGVMDVNVPYRLIHSSLLRDIIMCLPESLCVPNIVISGVIARSGLPVCNILVPHKNRITGTVSIAKRKLLKFVFIAFFQVLLFRFSMKFDIVCVVNGNNNTKE